MTTKAQKKSRLARAKKIHAWLMQRDLVLLCGALIAAVLALTFMQIADNVIEGDTQEVDERIVQILRDPVDAERGRGPRGLESAVRDVTALGSTMVLTLLSIGVIGFLLIQRKYHAALFFLSAIVGALLVCQGLKAIFDRPRPGVLPELLLPSSASFPSGHTVLSAAVYLTLGSLLARMSEQKRMKLYFVVFALLLTGLVGISRVYLGVHYPSDVVAGWTVGLAWALVCWLVARKLQRTGKVERDVAHPEPPKA